LVFNGFFYILKITKSLKVNYNLSLIIFFDFLFGNCFDSAKSNPTLFVESAHAYPAADFKIIIFVIKDNLKI